jgi:hypothetical protein
MAVTTGGLARPGAPRYARGLTSGTCSALLYGIESSSSINSLADGTKFRLDTMLDTVSISS